MSAGLAQSVQARLVAHAKKIGVDPNLVLARYASERLLYRLSRSRYAERFIPPSAKDSKPLPAREYRFESCLRHHTW